MQGSMAENPDTKVSVDVADAPEGHAAIQGNMDGVEKQADKNPMKIKCRI